MRTRRHFGKTSRLGAGLVIVLVASCIALLLGVLIGGCEDDSDEEPVGTSVIQGTVDSFEGNGAYYFPAGRQTLWAKVAAWVSEAVVSSAYAGQGGVTVYLLRDGSVFRSTTTDDEGTFVFSELPAGDYQFRFEYQGQEVSYHAESGQAASITVGNNQIVDLVGIRISGDRVNIGNIRVVQPDQSAQPIEGGESARDPHSPPTEQTSEAPRSTIWYSGIRNTGLGEFDVNNDGTNDFEFRRDRDRGWDLYFAPKANNQAVGPLSKDTLINQQNPASGWYAEEQLMLEGIIHTTWDTEWGVRGPWGVSSYSPERIGYMGLRFMINGATHYGWAKLTTAQALVITLNYWAYETRPGVGIKAGQTE